MKASKIFNKIISNAWILAIACSSAVVSSCCDDDNKTLIGEYLQIEGFSETSSSDSSMRWTIKALILQV